ncbi:MAG: broad specificity phosphatase PhoE [Paraglaciecola sp.]|jgi:broad specificity phosphatase PhoE
MSEFYLVRHGQASFGADNYDKLSALGLQQARWLGEYFEQRDMKFSQLWSGDLRRHRETAAGICSALSHEPQSNIFPALNEFDFKNIADAYLRLHPNERPAANAQAADFYRLLKKAMKFWAEGKLPAQELSESWQQFRSRVHGVIQELCNNNSKQPMLIVSSGGAISMLISIVLGFEHEQVIEMNMQVKNAGFSHFYFNKSTVRLSSFNNVPHLDIPERAGAVTFS